MRRDRSGLLRCASVLLLGGGAALAGEGVKVGEKVRDFDYQKLLNGDGRTSFAEFRGQPILLEWWGTH